MSHATTDTFAATPTDSPDPAPSRLRRLAREWVYSFALVLAILIPIRGAVADWNDVPSGSMRPTILEGDRIWVNKLAYGLRIPFTTTWIARWDEPDRGEIVTFASPQGGTRLVKRIIGLPGDRIALAGNRLIINGVAADYLVTDPASSMTLPDGRTLRVVIADEELPSGGGGGVGGGGGGKRNGHPITLTPGLASPSTIPEFTVPEGHYFVMGDNRDQSMDSRMLGFVPAGDIYGRSSYVALSLDPENYYLPRFGRWFSRLP